MIRDQSKLQETVCKYNYDSVHNRRQGLYCFDLTAIADNNTANPSLSVRERYLDDSWLLLQENYNSIQKACVFRPTRTEPSMRKSDSHIFYSIFYLGKLIVFKIRRSSKGLWSLMPQTPVTLLLPDASSQQFPPSRLPNVQENVFS